MIATVVVDPQVDFVDGVLGVPGGVRRIHAINQHLRDTSGERLVIFTRCQHHPTTEAAHFEQYGVHCIKGTPGALWHNQLLHNYSHCVINKGQVHADPSPWDGYTDDGCSLQELLAEKGVEELEVCGFVAEVCVKAMLKGAVARGYPTTLLVGATAAIDPKDGLRDAVLEAITDGVYIG